MARYTYDVGDILQGAATESPFVLILPSGGRQVIAALVSEGEWRSRWSYNGHKLTDEQFDEIDEIVAGIYRGIEDGENMDELSSAIRYLADNLQVSHDGNISGSANGGCCFDPISDVDVTLQESGNGITQEIIDAIRSVVPGAFTDTGANFPTDFADRASYDAAKCAAANQLFRDFRTTLGGLQILDFAIIVGSMYLLGNALFGAGGVIAGAIAAGAAIPVSMIAMIVFMLSFALLFNNIGLRLKAIAERLDRETFVCAMFEATTYEEGRTALVNMVQDAHDLAILEGAFTLNELFEGKLLELVAVLVPNELLETVLQGAAILVDILVELPEDIDCATCGGGGTTEMFSLTDFNTVAAIEFPRAGWYQLGGSGNTGTPSNSDFVRATVCCSNKAAHDVTFPSDGTVNLSWTRFGAATNVNVSLAVDKWDGANWVTEQTVDQKTGTGTSVELTTFNVTAGLYRFAFRLHNNPGTAAYVKDMSCLFTPS